MTDLEAISRLISGDLGPEAEAALRLRLKSEPDLAAQLESMTQMISDLQQLPELEPPVIAMPVGLPKEVVIRPRSYATSSRWAGVALLAATLLFWAMFRPADTVVVQMDQGEQVVIGAAQVIASGLPIDINGKVRVSVEPPAGVVREGGQEIEMHMPSSVAGVVAGAIVTVTVISGTAAIRGDGVVKLEPGESHTVSAPASRNTTPPSSPIRATQSPPEQRPITESVAPMDLVTAKARIQELEDQVSMLQFEGALARGQVSAMQGEPQDWPNDVPEALTERAFTDSIESAIAQIDHARIIEIDCSEYPCIAVMESLSDAEDWTQELEHALHDVMGDDAFDGENTSVTSHASTVQVNDTVAKIYAFGVSSDQHGGQDIKNRTSYRADSLMEDAAIELTGEP